MPYILNGDLAEISGEPRLENGVLFVPLRKLATALGANVDFESSTKTAILYMGDNIATFANDKSSVNFNGTETPLTAAPFVEEGELWVPVRAFESVLGLKLNADPQNGIVELSTT